MKKAIVTGANGFVGQYLVNALIDANYLVYAVIRKGGVFKEKFEWNDRIRIVELNLDEYSKLPEYIEEEIDAFFHLAWQGSAGNDRQNIVLQLKNVEWTCDAIKASHRLGCLNFIGAGSIMELETFKAVYAQGNKPGAAYIYGAAKQSAHSMGKALAASLQMDFKWAMITNAYGPGETSPRFINTTIRKMIKREPLQFTSGTQNYDFIYVEDVAKAFVHICEKGVPFKYYVIGSNQAQALRNYIKRTGETLAPEQTLHFGDVPFTGINLSLEEFDSSDIRNDTGFECDVDFESGVQKTYEWIKEMYDSQV